MLINAQFQQPAIILPNQHDWVESAQSGVSRMMLDRIGEEKARATSLVHYQQSATFPAHTHPGGEEIFVLSGTFSDETGDYPQGYYLRNPVGSSHTPISHEGTLIFVKLWQMDPKDDAFVRVNTHADVHWTIKDGNLICPLFNGFNEEVYLQRFNLDELLTDSQQAIEILVLAGELLASDSMSAKLSNDCNIQAKRFPKYSWMRFPEHYPLDLVASQSGTSVLIKRGAFKNTSFELSS